ncbi:WSSV503 [White spot syndrome virus]|uniref:WSSV503 n=1 Tax=White spot syndrome virus TaxID=342409 RepID=A0A2I6SCI7_9VIRU|nr:WSSV503 [White spot syndrome virus]
MATFQTDADFFAGGDDTSRYEEVMKTLILLRQSGRVI